MCLCWDHYLLDWLLIDDDDLLSAEELMNVKPWTKEGSRSWIQITPFYLCYLKHRCTLITAALKLLFGKDWHLEMILDDIVITLLIFVTLGRCYCCFLPAVKTFDLVDILEFGGRRNNERSEQEQQPILQLREYSTLCLLHHFLAMLAAMSVSLSTTLVLKFAHLYMLWSLTGGDLMRSKFLHIQTKTLTSSRSLHINSRSTPAAVLYV